MKIDSQNTVFLIDGSSFLYRAYYGLRPLHTSQGVPVQAVYSFCRIIKKLIDSFDVKHVVLVWDSKGKTTRHELFPEYKATRQAPPADIFDQKEYISKFAELVGIQQVAQSGLEADDIMYSLAQEYTKMGKRSVFVTSDKDMAQALSDSVIIFDPLKHEYVTQELFQEKNGYSVNKIPFYYALLGDASDNIPGVSGIGKKIATDLVKQFDSLAVLYENLDLLKPRMKLLLQEQKENAFLSLQLFLLQYHPIQILFEETAFDSVNWALAIPLFKELEFTSLVKEMGQTKQEVATDVHAKIQFWQKYNFECVTDKQALEILCTHISIAKLVAIDTETTGTHPLQAHLVGISLAYNESSAYYIPLAHHTNETQLDFQTVTTLLGPLLKDTTIKKYMHNAKYDLLILKRHNLPVLGLEIDTMVAARLVFPDWQKVGLKSLSQTCFEESMISFEEIVKIGSYHNFQAVPLAYATLYAAADAFQTLRLVSLVRKELEDKNLFELYRTVEHPLIFVLSQMEEEGIFVDKEYLGTLSKHIGQELQVIEAAIYAHVGAELNLNSPKQVAHLLFEKLQLPVQKKSAKGTGYSTDIEVLTALAKIHFIPELLVRHRELTKLKTTYVDALPNYINPVTGKIHTSFNQISVATGRLASSDPNLQNIPASGLGLEVRAAFKPGSERIFLAVDYSQIELRVLAYLAQDATLINAFNLGADIHQETAATIFGVSASAVTHEQRQVGKRINFSILYGVTPYGLSKDLGISFKDAKDYIERYFAHFPAVKQWMYNTVEYTKKNGYVQTYGGRRRYIPTIYEKNKNMYEEACRVAINTVAQGTAAEIMKQGMIALHKGLIEQKRDANIVLQIHDELLLTVAQPEKDIVEELCRTVLESVVPSWNVRMEIKVKSGFSWKDLA